MPVLYTNNATSTLSAGIAAGATSLSVAAGQGSRFPSISGSDYFYATLINSGGTIEIVKVTARATDTLTVVRGQDGTTAVSWSAGDRVELRVTKAMLDDLKADARTGTYTSDINFSGAGLRITGDLSNATASNRLAFQSSVTNGNTVVTTKPNGTAAGAFFIAHNSQDADNSGYFYLGVNNTSALLRSDKNGTGSYLPLAINVAGFDRLVFATSGAWGVNGTNYGTSGQVLVSQGSGTAPVWSTINGAPDFLLMEQGVI